MATHVPYSAALNKRYARRTRRSGPLPIRRRPSTVAKPPTDGIASDGTGRTWRGCLSAASRNQPQGLAGRRAVPCADTKTPPRIGAVSVSRRDRAQVRAGISVSLPRPSGSSLGGSAYGLFELGIESL